MSGGSLPPAWLQNVRPECDTCASSHDVITRNDGVRKCAYCRRAEFVLDAANNHMRTMEATHGIR